MYTILADGMDPDELAKLLREPATPAEELAELRALGEDVSIQ